MAVMVVSAVQIVGSHEQLQSYLRLYVEIRNAVRAIRVAHLVIQVLNELLQNEAGDLWELDLPAALCELSRQHPRINVRTAASN